jgi:hypothetical protein
MEIIDLLRRQVEFIIRYFRVSSNADDPAPLVNDCIVQTILKLTCRLTCRLSISILTKRIIGSVMLIHPLEKAEVAGQYSNNLLISHYGRTWKR